VALKDREEEEKEITTPGKDGGVWRKERDGSLRDVGGEGKPNAEAEETTYGEKVHETKTEEKDKA